MKDKLYDPARINEKAPAEGMASVNTHMPIEETRNNRNPDEKADNREKATEKKGGDADKPHA